MSSLEFKVKVQEEDAREGVRLDREVEEGVESVRWRIRGKDYLVDNYENLEAQD